MRLLTGAVQSAGAVVALDLLLCVVIVAVRGAIFCVVVVVSTVGAKTSEDDSLWVFRAVL